MGPASGLGRRLSIQSLCPWYLCTEIFRWLSVHIRCVDGSCERRAACLEFKNFLFPLMLGVFFLCSGTEILY